jgi:type I restriction enzyme S subunit
MAIAELPSGWHLKTLGEVCEINPSRREIASLPDDVDVSFVPMAAVSEDGKLVEVRTRKAKEVKRGFRHFKEGDVLLAKITPCFENGKRWLASSLLDGVGFGSTEFHVLRARSKVLPEWIYYFVCLPQFRIGGQRRMTGTAGQKRVPAAFLAECEIPVPPLPVQQNLVGALKRAERLREIRDQANQLTSKIIQSVFLKVFGDPGSNPMDWEIGDLGAIVGELRYGTSVKCKSEPNGGIPVLRIPNVLGGAIDLSDLKFAELSQSDRVRFGLQDGDLLFVRSNGNREYVGRCAVFHEIGTPYAFASYLIRARLRIDRLRPDFASVLLSFPALRDQLFARARTSAGQYNINSEGLRSVKVIVPPLEHQDRFVSTIKAVRLLQRTQRESTAEVNELFHSLMYKAFRGELRGAS